MDVRLIYFGANGQRREVHLHVGVVSVGRAEECHLRIPADTVSRRHCQIQVSAKQVVLTDMGSSNGTLVNGQKIVDDEVVLKAGDNITVGPATFTLQIDGKPEKVARADQARPPEPTVDQAVEEALAGSSLSDEAFDPFSMLEEMPEENIEPEEEEEDDGIPPQPRQAVIPRSPPDASGRKGPPGAAAPSDRTPPGKPGPKPKE